MSMVCRSDGTYEAVQQTAFLKKGQSYCFRLQLAFNSAEGGTDYIHYPTLFRVWSGSTFCTREELLWTSPVIDHTEWRTYQISFTCQQSQPFIIFEAYFAQSYSYWGRVLVDNLHSVENLDILPKDTTLCLLDSLYLTTPTQGWKQIQWLDSTDQVVSQESSLWVSKPGLYKVKTWDGCLFYTDSIRVGYRECEDKFFVPNLVTPNQDGKNEVFAFKGIGYSGWQLQLINRWGEQVYHSDDYQQDWPRDKPKAGLYYYRLEKSGFKPILGWLHVLYE